MSHRLHRGRLNVVTAAFFLLLAATAYVGLLRCETGRDFVVRLEGAVRSRLVQTPLSRRGRLWHAAEILEGLVVQLPLFVIGYGADRMRFYDKMHETMGDVTPFVGGVALHRFHQVADVLQSARQPRGRYIGARMVPGRCMEPSSLLFRSTGEEHTRMRSFIRTQLAGLASVAPSSALLPSVVTESNDGDMPETTTVKVRRAIARNLWHRIFGERPSHSTEANLLEYFEWGGTCIFGQTFHAITFNYFLRNVERIRKRAYADAKNTKVGAALFDAALAEFGDTASAIKVLSQVSDSVLFAGLLGVSHLVERTLARVRQAPEKYAPLWHADPEAFLLESARVDPPVTSVTAVLEEDRVFDNVGSGLRSTGQVRVLLEKGTTVQLSISTANRDPKIFGGPAQSRKVARQFDPTRPRSELDKVLSWNGMHASVVKGSAPRGCLGFHVGFKLAIQVIDRYFPHVDSSTAHRGAGGDAGARGANATTSSKLHDLTAANSAFSMHGSSFNRVVGESIWFVSCAIGTLYIKYSVPTSYGLVSGAFAHFLVAHAARAFCKLVALRFAHAALVGDLAGVQIGWALFRVWLLGRSFSINPNLYRNGVWAAANSQTTTVAAMRSGDAIDDASGRPRISGYKSFRNLTVAVSLLFCFLHVTVADDYPSFHTLTSVFVHPALLLAMFSMARFWFLEDPKSPMRSRMLLGVMGCAVAVVNRIWPRWVARGVYFSVLQHASNAVFVVPLVVLAALALDERLEWGVGSTGYGDRAHRKRRRDSAELRKHEGSKTRWWLRLGIGSALSVLALAIVLPALSDGVRGAALCFHGEEATRPDDCAEGARAMDAVDPHTRTLYRILKTLNSPRGKSVPLGSRVVVPTKLNNARARLGLPKMDLFYGSKIPTWDLDYHSGPRNTWGTAVAGFFSDLIFDYLRLGLFNPLIDIATPWESVENATRVLETAVSHDLTPLKLVDWKEMTSDFAMTRWCFAGLAAHNTVRVAPLDSDGIVFKNDYDWMHRLDVRPGFERYGATAFFDKRGALVKMWWSHGQQNISAPRTQHNGDDDGSAARELWEHAKWSFKCSAMAGVTLKDHLVGLHFMASNFLTMASAEQLGHAHPLRRMLRPHTYGAVSINLGAVKTLAVENGLVHRAAAFTWDALQEGFRMSFALNRFHGDSVSMLKENGMLRVAEERPELYPFGRDLLDFYSVVTTFVSDYVDIYYVDNAAVVQDRELVQFWDALSEGVGKTRSSIPPLSGKRVLKGVLAMFIVHVTGYHNQAGNVADYLVNPSFASAKIRPGRNVADVQSTFQGLNIGLMTAMLAPKLVNDFTHLLLRDEHLGATIQVFQKFSADLQALSGTIDERNAQRPMPCNAFNPRIMTSSISI